MTFFADLSYSHDFAAQSFERQWLEMSFRLTL